MVDCARKISCPPQEGDGQRKGCVAELGKYMLYNKAHLVGIRHEEYTIKIFFFPNKQWGRMVRDAPHNNAIWGKLAIPNPLGFLEKRSPKVFIVLVLKTLCSTGLIFCILP